MLRKAGRWVVALFAGVGLLSVIVVTTPVAEYLSRPLRLEPDLTRAEAIVVLGGGAYEDELPSIGSLTRAIYGYTLLRAGYAPRLLLSGGRARPEGGLEALAMKKFLRDVGAPADLILTEDRSGRTYGNATESAKILRSKGVTRILLVTHPDHMLRAKWTFEKAGLTVYPAPVPWDRFSEKRFDMRRAIIFYRALYEYAGIALYWWRGWL